jgi:peptide/nickel transport system substrate-binding protein
MPNRISAKGNNKRQLNRRQWLGALGIAGVAGLSGCLGGGGGGGSDGSNGSNAGLPEEVDELPEVSGTYDTVVSSAFDTLNPIYNTEASAGTAIGRTMDTGYTFDDNQEFFPLLYDMSTEDGSVWVFDIREDLQFSDPYGQVTADSFVYQIQELHQSDWANTPSATDWQGVTVEKTGKFQFQAELETPRLLWPESYEPSLYPIPKSLLEPYVAEEDVEGLKQDSELLELKFTGNLGPFTLDEWKRSAGTRYTRNDDYYIQNLDRDGVTELFKGAPYFEGASIDVVPEQSSRLGSLETGEADAASIPPTQFAKYSKDSRVSTFEIPQPYNNIISLNMRDNGWQTGPGNLFRSTQFRQGLAMAIDKEKLIKGVYRGLAEPHYTWQPSFSNFYPGDEALSEYKFGSGDLYGNDVARDRVKTAIDDSEFDYSYDGDTLVGPDGNQVTLGLYHSAGQNTEKEVAQFVKKELGENLGIKVNVEAIQGARFNDAYWTGTPPEEPQEAEELGKSWAAGPNNPGPRSVTSKNAWDMSLVYGLNTYPRNPMTNTAFFDGADAFYNPVGYYPDFNAKELWDQAENAQSEEELKKALEKIFVELAKEQPYIMLLFSDSLTGYNPDLRGPIENFSNGWDFAGWHFES